MPTIRKFTNPTIPAAHDDQPAANGAHDTAAQADQRPPLPPGWAWTTIGEVTEQIDKVDPSLRPDEVFTYLDISSIDNTTFTVIEPKTYVRAWLDVLVLLVVMDAAMYALHRAAHIALVYPIVHRTHHHYDKPHPLSLFVLNPFEALGFGALWLAVITLYPASWLGMAVYLALNVLWGTVGHLGVEPLPDVWQRLPLLRWLSTSTFHAQHHLDPGHNFGFYFVIWDRVFDTVSPHYASAFGRMQPH